MVLWCTINYYHSEVHYLPVTAHPPHKVFYFSYTIAICEHCLFTNYIFYFIITFNVEKHPLNRLVPVPNYIIAAINSLSSYKSLIFFYLLKDKKWNTSLFEKTKHRNLYSEVTWQTGILNCDCYSSVDTGDSFKNCSINGFLMENFDQLYHLHTRI